MRWWGDVSWQTLMSVTTATTSTVPSGIASAVAAFKRRVCSQNEMCLRKTQRRLGDCGGR
eukprot:12889940-Alexandrium_andersonii.AAC.1